MKIKIIQLIVGITLFTQTSWCDGDPKDLKLIQKFFVDLDKRLNSTHSELITIERLHKMDAKQLSDEDLKKLNNESHVQKQYDSIKSELKTFTHFFYGKNFDLSSYPFEDLSTIKLRHVSLKNSNMLRTKFSQADFSHSNFTNSTLVQSEFCNAKLKKTILKKADLSESKFIDTNLEKAVLFQADLSYTSFINSNLTKAVLEKCIAFNVSFWDTILKNANLTCICAEHAKFHSSSLENANLSNGNFKNAVFNFANMTNANACSANFEYATFDSANMKGVKFTTECKKSLGMLCNVKKANFIRVKGLTPEQKLFLKKNGAINVPT